jgi:hypothetical protein
VVCQQEGQDDVVADACLGGSGGGRVLLAAPDERGRVKEDPGRIVVGVLGGDCGLRHVG